MISCTLIIFIIGSIIVITQKISNLTSRISTLESKPAYTTTDDVKNILRQWPFEKACENKGGSIVKAADVVIFSGSPQEINAQGKYWIINNVDHCVVNSETSYTEDELMDNSAKK